MATKDWRNALFSLLVWAAALSVMAVFAWILVDLTRRGAPHLSWDFLSSEPESAGRAGGIAPILLSTLLILLVALATALPLGLGTAVWLAEYAGQGGKRGHAVRLSLDALAGVPSIIFGLFGNAFFCVFL